MRALAGLREPATWVCLLGLWALYAVAAMGCASDGTYTVRDYREGTAVAVSTERLLTVVHPPHVGQRLRVYIRGTWAPCVVARVGEHGLVELVGEHGALDVTPLAAVLQPGDSGSPFVNERGHVAALLLGRRP